MMSSIDLPPRLPDRPAARTASRGDSLFEATSPIAWLTIGQWRLVVLGALIALGGAIVAVLTRYDVVEGWRFYVDPNAIGDRPGWYGAGALIGYCCWASCVANCLMAVHVLRARMQTSRAPSHGQTLGLLSAAALLSTIILVDDALMLHERIGSAGEVGLFLVYGAGVCGMLWRWRRILLRNEPVILALSLMALGASVGVDGVMPAAWVWSIVLEDTLTLVGEVLWLAYFSRLATRTLTCI